MSAPEEPFGWPERSLAGGLDDCFRRIAVLERQAGEHRHRIEDKLRKWTAPVSVDSAEASLEGVSLQALLREALSRLEAGLFESGLTLVLSTVLDLALNQLPPGVLKDRDGP